MRPRDLAALEFDSVLRHLAGFARASAGKEACEALRPTADAAAATRDLEAVRQCHQLMERHGDLPLGEFPDIRESLRRAVHAGFVLDGPALAAVRSVLDAAQTARVFLAKHAAAFPLPGGLARELAPLPELQSTLRRALDDAGNVTDDASEELAEVRREIRRLREKLSRRLEELVNRPAMADLVSDRFVTLRNNRFVVPLRTAAAARFDGVVQDRSGSGETMFVEPLFAVELNNRLLMAAKQEEALVRRILADLTALVADEVPVLDAVFAALVQIDVLAARARFSQRYRCTTPRLENGEVLLRQARHPLLLFSGRAVTPVDLCIPPGKRVLIITGPNTGGKTVALKTLGLLALMAQSGIPIPAQEDGRLPCFGGIYADVGDAQSIERDLSTFSAHVANLTEILAQEARPQLVLLDEPGVGTDPEEGAALGIGLIRLLEARAAHAVVSTHYAAIKVHALADEGCETAAVEFDVDRLAPLYRLVYHSVGESLALPIARRLGLPEAVVAEAQAARSEQAKAFGAAMARLEEARRGCEGARAEAEEEKLAASRVRAEVDALLADLREKRRRRWADELGEAREFVRGLREQGGEMLAAVRSGAADRHQLSRWVKEKEATISARAVEAGLGPAPVSGESRPPRIGEQVAVVDTGIRGELVSVEGERAWIRRGSLRFEVPVVALRVVARVSTEDGVRVRIEAAAEATPREVSLVGLRVREALARLEAFLDQAARARHPSVRIVHGIGSGALRRAVADYLSTSPYCAGFRTGEGSEGGAGVTVVDVATG